MLYAEAVPAVPPPPPLVRKYNLSHPCNLKATGTDGICDGIFFTQKPCLPSLLLHFTSANTVLSTPSGCSAPRSQSSAGLAAPCFCVQKNQTQIPDYHTHRMTYTTG